MTEPNRQSEENEERIIEIEIERLRPFKEHPFQVKDDKEMFLLQESIEKYIFDVCTRVWGIGIPIKRLTRKYTVAIKWRYGNTWVDLALICTPLYNETLRGCFTVGEKKKYQKNDD